ncbi:hypothetical protein [Hymenobacter sp. BRD67]|uniref:hypothetical protein n=1 Tax=Hymenobacter sp. BRD67 TaxID=2675877 RepID=UPI00156790DA|nr:hypothetical protein [Hymenobacter sp. BRD67]QKG54150.1 hypothetical protein GKZ67_18050 [Hymenobacter sp. BRD67]
MRNNYCWLSCLFFLVLAGQAKAQTTPADTLLGHAATVRRLSRAFCQQVTARGHQTALAALSPEAAQALVLREYSTVLQADTAAVRLLVAESQRLSEDQNDVAETRLSRQVLIANYESCPAGRLLAASLSQTTGARQYASAHAPALAPAERRVLLPLAVAMCSRLTAANARAPLAQLSLRQRRQRFMQVLHNEFKAHTDAMVRYYGPARIDTELRSGRLDQKIMSLMGQLPDCARYLVLLEGMPNPPSH